MKNLSKIMALLLAVCLAFALCACGGDKDGASAEKDADAKETLTMATNAEFPPYEYHEDGEIVGIDAEVAQAIADKLGMELVIEDMDFTAIISAIQGGKADIGMAGLTVTEDRLESVDFSTSYATGVQVIIVKEGSEITSLDDLSKGGYTIGVQESTTGDIYTTDDLESKDLATIERYNKGADAVQALLTDKIDCVVIDNEPAKAFVEANEGLTILETPYITEEYAICFAKDNDELSEKVNKALEELIEDGTVKSIIDKYITAE
ncbi:MAG: transporter substrate-binding domain-containing protein [Oscillospiraceae bacterium]|jgi:ABC-type amino acid transport substrate-binding protein